MTDLDTILRRWADDAAVLRRNGDATRADVLDRCVREATAAAGDWLTWIAEDEAVLRSGRSREWWRQEFKRLQPRGLARQVGARQRVYRLAAVPLRAALADAVAEGTRAARAMGKVA